MNRRSFIKTNLFGTAAAILASTVCLGADTIADGDVAALNTGDHAEFTLITAHGWVRFSVSSDWSVVSMNTKAPLKTALFQISTGANEQNPTGIAVFLAQIDSKEASDAFAASHEKAASGEKSRFDQWEMFKAGRKQGDTMYSIQTAFRDIADVHIWARLAWPHSSKNSASYDSEMGKTFETLLKSFSGELGNYQRRNDEVIRRPD